MQVKATDFSAKFHSYWIKKELLFNHSYDPIALRLGVPERGGNVCDAQLRASR